MCLAIPGKVERIDGDDPLFRTGQVSFDGVVQEASLSFVPEAGVGDYVVVHAGVAISVVDADEARQVFEMLARAAEEG